jgi:hypothetical protein
MPNRAHFWSDIPGIFSRSGKATADNHAEEDGGTVTQLTSLVQMHSVFRTVLHSNYAFDEVDFHTHGSEGAIYIGNDQFTFGKPLQPFENQGFEKIFKPNASITFNGCLVGDKWDGEYFLTEIGRVFLKSGGGKVTGNTAYGLNIGRTPHPFGTWVTATASPGGAVSLSGHSHLIPSVVKDRISSFAMRLKDLERRGTDVDLKPAKADMVKANDFASSAGNSSWYQLWQATRWVYQAEQDYITADLEANWHRSPGLAPPPA